jgi:hypothetical protein
VKLVYQVQFFVKDDSTLDSKDCYRLLLYSFNGNGAEFFNGEKPMNLYKKEKALERMNNYYNLLTKFNVYVDLVIQKVNSNQNSYFQIIGSIMSFNHLNLAYHL